MSQIQRLGRQILEALLFLKEKKFPHDCNLHSGNVILQNGVARYFLKNKNNNKIIIKKFIDNLIKDHRFRKFFAWFHI